MLKKRRKEFLMSEIPNFSPIPLENHRKKFETRNNQRINFVLRKQFHLCSDFPSRLQEGNLEGGDGLLQNSLMTLQWIFKWETWNIYYPLKRGGCTWCRLESAKWILSETDKANDPRNWIKAERYLRQD